MGALKSFQLSELFFDRGYEVFDDVLPAGDCATLAQKLKAAMEHDCIPVDNDGVHIKTRNGEALIAELPEIEQLYQQVYAQMAAGIANLLVLDDLPVAISANYLRRDQGHSFRYHFDRNEYTAVLYLTDSPDLPLCIHPKIRTDPALGESVWQYERDARVPVRVDPSPGRLVCFHARTSLHGVISSPEVPSTTDRISLQFAFDTRRRSFEDQQYYGRSTAAPAGADVQQDRP
ncbi:hypothetical protein [Silanimonas sp.]|uniref:hypothetical protein n=1 Tax=Silanimonas sp. TaxID=1929290 RepID=UPI0037CABDBF